MGSVGARQEDHRERRSGHAQPCCGRGQRLVGTCPPPPAYGLRCPVPLAYLTRPVAHEPRSRAGDGWRPASRDAGGRRGPGTSARVGVRRADHAPAGLRAEHLPVRRIEEIGEASPVLGPQGTTYAARQIATLQTRSTSGPPDRPHTVDSQRLHLGRRPVVGEDRELVTADSSHAVALVRDGQQLQGSMSQQLVRARVAVLAVDRLEVVDVDHQHTGALGQGLPGGPVAQAAQIVQPRERIRQGLSARRKLGQQQTALAIGNHRGHPPESRDQHGYVTRKLDTSDRRRVEQR